MVNTSGFTFHVGLCIIVLSNDSRGIIMYKRFIMFLLVALIINISLFEFVFAETLLYEKKSEATVSKGVIRQNIKRFTSNGWLNINVLRVDLKDPYIGLDTIFPKEGSSFRSTVLGMANDYGAVSAVNGDFFSPKPNTSLAHSIGPLVQSGKIVTTPADEENSSTFAVFGLSKRNIPSYQYWSKNITITAPNKKSMPINDINKFGWFTMLYMYDKNWGPKTIGKSERFPTLVEMVVVKNKVKSFSIASDPIDIPKDGYVITGDYEAGEYLKNNFRVGDIVKVNIKTVPNWNALKMAVGGGAILVKNGKVPSKFSHEKPESAPQTAIGTTKDNKEAIIVTVDGRQLASKGMDQYELANLMLEFGAYNAINLDGGGSTTMVSRELGHNELQIVNKHSDSNPRKVTNGIGVFSTAPKSSLSGIKIETQDINIFVNSSRAFFVVGYDKYYNPVQVDPKSINWSFEGVKGSFTDNHFHPATAGKGKVTAEVNGITASIDVKILDLPAELELYPTSFPVSEKPQWLGIVGVDKNGYRAFLHSEDITFTTKDLVTISENYIRSKNGKSGTVKASFGKVYSYFSVSAQNKVLDNFEQNNDTFWGYPSTVSGKYSIDNKHVKEGKYSGKLEFDFSSCEGTKAAYIRFGNDGYSIDSKPAKISTWVYTPQKYTHSIKAEFVDSNNQLYRVAFVSSIDWIGWKQLETALPEGITYPVKLKKIYVVETQPDIKNKGEFYFDELCAIYNESGNIKLPPSRKLRDYQEGYPRLKNSPDSYRVAVYGNISDDSALSKISRLSNSLSSFTTFTNNVSEEKLDLNVPYASNNGFNEANYKNLKIVSISSKGIENSIRKKDSNQWTSLFKSLKNNTADNVLVVLDSPIWGDYGFVDRYEQELLKKTLSDYVNSTNKNVWVVYSSKLSEVTNENGVKYIGIPDSSSKKYLCITVNDKELKYRFKRM